MMYSTKDVLVGSFPAIKTDQLLVSGPYDRLYRVRDLENDVWLLGRFFLNPVHPDRMEDLELEFEKSQQVQNSTFMPLVKQVVCGDRLAIFWDYRDCVTLEERLHRDFGPRKIVHLISAAVDAVLAAMEQQVRCEYISFHDILIDFDDRPLMMAGTFSHLLNGQGDSTAKVDCYHRRVINRVGAVLLSISFGSEYNELIQAVQLETDIHELIDRFKVLLNVDPGIMAIIAKCMMPIKEKAYQRIDELKLDLEGYLKGQAVSVDGVDFYRLIQNWRLRKQEQSS